MTRDAWGWAALLVAIILAAFIWVEAGMPWDAGGAVLFVALVILVAEWISRRQAK